MTTLTLQEVFDKVAAHLLTQNARSGKYPFGDETDEDNFECQYRGENGRMCAVGCLISNDKYHPGFEGLAVHAAESSPFSRTWDGSTELREALLDAGVNVDDEATMGLLITMQELHDSIAVTRWAEHLVIIGGQHALDLSVLTPTVEENQQ